MAAKEFPHRAGLAYADPALFGRLIRTLAGGDADYLVAQIEAGAEALMIFDSWAGEFYRSVHRVFLPARRVVCGPEPAGLRAAKLGVRSGVDRALHPDRRGRLAGLAQRRLALSGRDPVAGANGAQRAVDSAVFRPQLDGVAAIEMLLLWVAILVCVHTFRPVSPAAAWLMLPYLAWVSFALVLNLGFWWLN
jgi:hypothetical protein